MLVMKKGLMKKDRPAVTMDQFSASTGSTTAGSMSYYGSVLLDSAKSDACAPGVRLSSSTNRVLLPCITVMSANMKDRGGMKRTSIHVSAVVSVTRAVSDDP